MKEHLSEKSDRCFFMPQAPPGAGVASLWGGRPETGASLRVQNREICRPGVREFGAKTLCVKKEARQNLP
jgi:hypothetical protein